METTSFYNEGVDYKAIIMGIEQCVKEFGEDGMDICWKENEKIKSPPNFEGWILTAGRLARTVPDRPNSRNQKTITVRMI